MPLLRIDLAEGRDREQIRSIVDATHRAVVSVLGIPERDRFQIVHEHPAEHIIAQDAGLGFERGNVVMIQIFTQRGRTRQAKQELFRAIADALAGVGVPGEDVFVGIVENGPEDWSFGHGRAQYVEGDLPVPGATR